VAEVRERVAAEPKSFLAVDVPVASFEAGQDPYAPEVYEAAAEAFDALFDAGDIVTEDEPVLFIYQQEQDGHTQTGVVAALPVADYETGRIAQHEHTRLEKENDRVHHIEAVGAQTGPIFLTYRDEPAVDALVARECAREPLFNFVDAYGCRNTVWRVSDTGALARFITAFEPVERVYIADGHHRAASAARVARARAQAQGAGAGAVTGTTAGTIMCVLVPKSNLELLSYNRVVADTNGMHPSDVLEALELAGFVAKPSDEAYEEVEHHAFAMYLGGAWYRVTPQVERLLALEHAPATQALDVAVLQDAILGPILGIDDPRTNARISFMGGAAGREALERAAGPLGVAFALAPTSIDEVMAVADAGEVMPPKSTWFEPKLRSGLFFQAI
jgi:uncharacterized protein (DUF1015 family)